MTEPNDAGAAPAASDATPPAGAGAGTGAAPAAGAPAKAKDPAVLESELEQARRDAAGYREKLRLREEADKSEEQKRQEAQQALLDENRSLKAERQQYAARFEAASTARRLGFKDEEVAYAVVAGSVEFDDQGKPKNIERLLSDLAKSKPWMVNGTTDMGQGPRGGAPGAGGDMNAAIRAAAGR